jgi:phage-related protein (TIGR01555 family)
MGAIVSLMDRLSNLMTGAGTSADKRAHGFYSFVRQDPRQIEARYRGSWLMRKAVNIPAFDMTRAWRDWQAAKDQIELLEAEEKRLGVRAKVRQALVLGRLGGGVMILGAKQDSPDQPLLPDRLGAGSLDYVHVMSRHRISFDGGMDYDPASPTFGQPKMWMLNGTTGVQTRIHPSRVIAFRGEQVPDTGATNEEDLFWGDSVVEAIDDAVLNADMAQNGFASLIDEAKLDIIKMPGLMQSAATAEYEKRFMERFRLANLGKSAHRALIIDGEEEWDQRQVTWAGMPVIKIYLAIVAGASDIPATRLLGKSPDGQNSTGESDLVNYETMITARQENDLRPLVERIDDLLIPSALGSRDKDIYWEWAPLRVMTEKERADLNKVKADTTKIYSDSGLIPTIALEKGVQNQIVEDGVYPGIDGALAELSEQERFPSLTAPDPNEDPSALTIDPKTGQPIAQKGGRTAANDAAPRTLYVSRKLLNGAEFIKWAKSQGFDTTTPADDLHVTITFSRTPVDWMKMGSDSWGSDGKGNLEVAPGGARLVEALGDKGAAVLLFANSSLSWRHEEMVRNGASWDFPEYQPHVTITYQKPADLDLSKVEPYRGKLVFGPEIFAEVVDDWEKGVSEE